MKTLTLITLLLVLCACSEEVTAPTATPVDAYSCYLKTWQGSQDIAPTQLDTLLVEAAYIHWDQWEDIESIDVIERWLWTSVAAPVDTTINPNTGEIISYQMEIDKQLTLPLPLDYFLLVRAVAKDGTLSSVRLRVDWSVEGRVLRRIDLTAYTWSMYWRGNTATIFVNLVSTPWEVVPKAGK